MGAVSLIATHKRQFLVRNMSYDVLIVKIGQVNAGWAWAEESSKKGLNQNMRQVTQLPRSPTLSQRHMDLHVWSYPSRRSYIVQGSSKSVQEFVSSRGGVEIWPFPLLWLLAFTTACTAYESTSRDRTSRWGPAGARNLSEGPAAWPHRTALDITNETQYWK